MSRKSMSQKRVPAMCKCGGKLDGKCASISNSLFVARGDMEFLCFLSFLSHFFFFFFRAPCLILSFCKINEGIFGYFCIPQLIESFVA